MARRHLYYDVDEWRAMPAWKTRMYEEGLVAEFGTDEEAVETVPLGSLFG